jgi:integrase
VDLSWIGFHTLRRTRITEVAATDFALAMTMAGHATPATTAAYVDRSAHGTLDLGGIRHRAGTR